MCIHFNPRLVTILEICMNSLVFLIDNILEHFFLYSLLKVQRPNNKIYNCKISEAYTEDSNGNSLDLERLPDPNICCL